MIMEEYSTISFHPIGVIHSPFKERKGMPIQPKVAKNIKGKVSVFPEYQEGLADLAGFSHIVLLYYFHMSSGYSLKVVPFLVELTSVEGTNLHIQGVDILDGTPLLDIKPHVPTFDAPPEFRTGWLEGKAGKAPGIISDSRFV